MTATVTLTPHAERVTDPNHSAAAHLDAVFPDGSRLLVSVVDLTPDEDGYLRYEVVVRGPGYTPVFRWGDLFSGDDGRIDYMRALRSLLDILLDYGSCDLADVPEWWTDTLGQWVFDRWSELHDLHEAVLKEVRDR